MRKFNTFFKALLLIIFCGFSFLSFAQTTVKQLIISSGGDFIDPANTVKLFTYNPITKSKSVFDSVPGRFTREIVIDNGTAYISVDSMLYKYNLDTYKRTDSMVVDGINRMMVHNNFLIISRWFPATSGYIEIYNKNDLSLIYRDLNVNAFTKGIVVLRDTAYIAVSAFDSGKVAVISLSSAVPTFVQQINMDTTTKGMEDIFTDGNNLYTLSYPFGADFNALTIYNLISGSITHKVMPKSMDGVVLLGNMLYANFGNGLQSYNTTTQTLGTVVNSMNYYRGNYDTLNEKFYMIDFNFSSNNKVYVMSRAGAVTDTFDVGMSTEAIAIDYRTVSGISEIKNASQNNITVYPNPAKNTIQIVTDKPGRNSIKMSDITGKTVLQKSVNMIAEIAETINIENLPAGIYILQLNTVSGTSEKKIIKE